MTLRVLVAGGDEETCWLLRLVLQQTATISVVGHATSGHELTSLLREVPAEIVLVDGNAAGEGILTGIQMARLQGRCRSVIVLSGGGDEKLRSVADGVLNRDLPFEQLASSLQALAINEAASQNRALALAQEPSVQLLGAYIADLERSQQELSERLNVVEFWLQGTDFVAAGDQVPASRPIAANGGGRTGYSLSVDGFFNAQHKVTLDGIEGKMHHHSWRVNVRLRQDALSDNHTVLGFAEAKQKLRGEISWLDGKTLNDLPQFRDVPPTTENVTVVLYRSLKEALRPTSVILESVTIWESPTNSITYSGE